MSRKPTPVRPNTETDDHRLFAKMHEAGHSPAPRNKRNCSCRLQDVPTQVGVLDQLTEVLVHVSGIDGDGFAVAIRGFVAQRIQQALEYRV